MRFRERLGRPSIKEHTTLESRAAGTRWAPNDAHQVRGLALAAAWLPGPADTVRLRFVCGGVRLGANLPHKLGVRASGEHVRLLQDRLRPVFCRWPTSSPVACGWPTRAAQQLDDRRGPPLQPPATRDLQDPPVLRTSTVMLMATEPQDCRASGAGCLRAVSVGDGPRPSWSRDSEWDRNTPAATPSRGVRGTFLGMSDRFNQSVSVGAVPWHHYAGFTA